MLVWSDGVAGEDGDADQRVVMGNYGRGCGSQRGSDGANRARMWSVGPAIKLDEGWANRGVNDFRVAEHAEVDQTSQ